MKALPRPTRRGRIVVFAGVALIILGALSGLLDAVRAGIFVLVLALLAFFAALAGRAGSLKLSRSGPQQRLRVGDDAQISLDVTARGTSWLGATLVEPHTFAPDGTKRWPLGQLRHARAAYNVEAPHRGVFSSGPARLETRDPFGLFATSRQFGARSQWLVRPRTESIDSSTLTSRGDGDDTVVSAHATHSGRPGASIREYVQGDDLRTVHWPATAHRGELMVRQFDPPAQPRTHVVLFGNVPTAGTARTWEWLVSAAASACTELDRLGVPTSTTIGDREYDRLDDTLDALAEAGVSTPGTRTLDENPTWLFLHTSVEDLPNAPHHSPAWAWVAGPSARDTVAALGRRGWHAVAVHPNDSIAEALYPALTGGDAS